MPVRQNFNFLLRCLRHPACYFGIPLIVIAWLATAHRIASERVATTEHLSLTTSNLARVFEENVIRSISEVDKILLFIRAGYDRARGTPDWAQLLVETYVASEMIVQIAVIDENGMLRATNHAPRQAGTLNLSDREHFRAHVGTSADTLFISRPVLGRASQKWSLQLTRRLTKADGQFGGVLVASVDPFYLSRFYDSIELGDGGSIALIGTDGIVRAGGIDAPMELGRDIAHAPALSSLVRSTDGVFAYETHTEPHRRMIAHRVVRGLPLIVSVTAAEPVLNPLGAAARSYVIGAALLTMVVVTVMVVALGDSRRLERARLALARSEQHERRTARELKLTLDHMSQGILMVDVNDNVAVINRQAVRLLDLPDDLLSRRLTYQQLIEHQDDGAEFRDLERQPAVMKAIRSTAARDLVPHYERTRPNGTVLEVRTVSLPDGGFVRTFTDITANRRSEAQIRHLARHDALTNLSNRVVFRQELETAIEDASRDGGFALHLIDLDRFKGVNDQLGHPVGDRLLKAVAQRLRGTVRGGDIVARLGGDEFAILQPNVFREQEAAALAARLCSRLSEPFEIEGHRIVIGASVGIALARDCDTTPDAVLKSADLALYTAKAGGRGKFQFFDREMTQRVEERQALELALREAVGGEQLEVHYQSIHDLATGAVTGYEALMRWTHPERGRISPAEFIPLAEDVGLIVPMGAWALRRACRDVAALPGRPKLAVNVSSVQLGSGHFIDDVKRALEDSGLPADQLELEITERILLQRDSHTLAELHELRTLGVHISMDDFGTGYSSLSYLMSFPIDRIKIDRSFVDRVSTETSSRAIIKAIVDLAGSLGMSTTAEGIESAEQAEVLRALGCGEAQGFAFSRPEPAERAFTRPPAPPLLESAA